MGTNYYLETDKCPHCGRSENLHIGKSSGGWKFLFQKIDGKAENYAQWVLLMQKGTITDEYCKEHSLKDFLELVESKQHEQGQHYKGMEMIEGYNFMSGDFS